MRNSDTVFVDIIGRAAYFNLVIFVAAAIPEIVDQCITRMQGAESNSQFVKFQCLPVMTGFQCKCLLTKRVKKDFAIVVLIYPGVFCDIGVVESNGIGANRGLKICQCGIKPVFIQVQDAHQVEHVGNVGMLFAIRFLIHGECSLQVA